MWTVQFLITAKEQRNKYHNRYKETKKTIIRWENLIISRNSESKLSENLQFNKDNDRFEDITFEKKEILDYCQYLLENPPKYDMKENGYLNYNPENVMKIFKEVFLN